MSPTHRLLYIFLNVLVMRRERPRRPELDFRVQAWQMGFGVFGFSRTLSLPEGRHSTGVNGVEVLSLGSENGLWSVWLQPNPNSA